MKRLVSFFLATSCALGISAQDPFTFDGGEIKAGSLKHITIPLADDEGNETTIPITVFHGRENGPVLGITAGVHGYEYAPILATHQLIRRINPQELKGTVILVHIANVASFQGRSPYTSPIDDKNLNRVFPGNPEGSITERLAAYLSEEVMGRSDFFVDMHSGDAPEDLRPYCGYYHHDDRPEISERSKEMAVHMGFDHLVVFNTTNKDYMKKEFPSLYCSAEAFKRGVPSVDIECGRLGLVEDELVNQIVRSVESVLQHLEMVPGDPIKLEKIAMIRDRSSVSSTQQGFFYPLKKSGDYVLKGMSLGYITNHFNETLEEIYAPRSGVILYILGTPPINSGETIASIGVIEE